MDDLLQTVVNAHGGLKRWSASIDMKLEVIVIPVSDVDRAKEPDPVHASRLISDEIDALREIRKSDSR